MSLWKKIFKSPDKDKQRQKEEIIKEKYVPVTTAQDDWDDYHGRKSND